MTKRKDPTRCARGHDLAVKANVIAHEKMRRRSVNGSITLNMDDPIEFYATTECRLCRGIANKASRQRARERGAQGPPRERAKKDHAPPEPVDPPIDAEAMLDDAVMFEDAPRYVRTGTKTEHRAWLDARKREQTRQR